MGLGSGIRKKHIPNPGSQIQVQGSKRHWIPDPDPQHWYFYSVFDFAISLFLKDLAKWQDFHISRILW